MAMDPVCFADVDEIDAEGLDLTCELSSQIFFFCSEVCKDRFLLNPGAFIGRTTDHEIAEECYPDNFIG